jgi:hypothetical protein
MPHRFQCQCGLLRGEVDQPRRGVRAVCYCSDCQAYAHLLGAPGRVLDTLGGTDVVATHARAVRITSGSQALACLSLSPRGLLRWYASCCKPPIANTPRDPKLPYVGLVHTCLNQPDPMERSFGAVQMHVNTRSAKGKPPRGAAFSGMARFAVLVLRLTASRLRGKPSARAFFDAQGAPVTQVVVASPNAVEQARRAAGQPG